MRVQTMLLSVLVTGLLLGASMSPAQAADASKSARPAAPAMEDQRGPWDYAPYMNLSPEKQSALRALFKEQWEKNYPLREQLWTKRTTLFALQDNPKTDPQQVTALVNEMASLRTKLHNEHLAFEQKVQKEFGIDLSASYQGMGRGAYDCDGYGRGGYGCAGYGPGSGMGWGRGGGYGHRGGMGWGHGGGYGHRGMGGYW